MIWTLLLLLLTIVAGLANGDAASKQLETYAESTSDSAGNLTTTTGVIVKYNETRTLNKRKLILNKFFMESMSSFVRERIPERAVHAKGTGAFGYFTVTNDITDICKAKLFSEVGKKTSIAVRFSSGVTETGGADNGRETRGFAVKFYTEDGNLDLIGLSVPVFESNDPTTGPHFVHSEKRNPATGMKDPNMIWDFITLTPETLLFFLYLFSDQGIPANYRKMNGFPVHTFQLVNSDGEKHFVRFHFVSDAGVEYLTTSEAASKAGTDPDFATRDLYNAIASEDYPTYTLAVQVMNTTDLDNAKFDPFDISKEWSQSEYPLKSVGQLVLDKNPTNHFAQIEQMALSPCNLVPGISGSPDKTFEARCMLYRDAQLYRLGVNFNKILVNQPLNKTFTYLRDGVSPVNDNEEGAPVYYPNSFHGPEPSYVDDTDEELIEINEETSDNYEESGLFYNQLTEDEKSRLVENIVTTLALAAEVVQERALTMFNMADSDFADRVRVAINSTTTSD